MSSSVPRITGIRTIGLKRDRDRAITSATNTDTLIEIQTDVGIVGWGSCYTSHSHSRLSLSPKIPARVQLSLLPVSVLETSVLKS